MKIKKFLHSQNFIFGYSAMEGEEVRKKIYKGMFEKWCQVECVGYFDSFNIFVLIQNILILVLNWGMKK